MSLRVDTRMRAISIRQPFVELIMRRKKREEYRTQPTRIRGRVWIYSSLKPADDPASWRTARSVRGTLPVGAIIGSVEIVDCYWKPRWGCYAYVSRAPRRLRMPRIARNKPQPRFWMPKFAKSPRRGRAPQPYAGARK